MRKKGKDIQRSVLQIDKGDIRKACTTLEAAPEIRPATKPPFAIAPSTREVEEITPAEASGTI